MRPILGIELLRTASTLESHRPAGRLHVVPMRFFASPISMLALAAATTSLFAAGCNSTATATPAPTATTKLAASPPAPSEPPDEGVVCRARVDAVLASPPAPGAPDFDAARIEILGRARGEPFIFVREPAKTSESALDERLLPFVQAFSKQHRGGRIVSLVKRLRHDPRALRSLLLREGYAYSADPLDALALISHVKLTDLFDEPRIFLQRGNLTMSLERTLVRKKFYYVDSEGKPADMLFGDRMALDEADLATPLHRDVVSLAESVGFDRMRIRHMTGDAIVADLRFGNTWAAALLDTNGSDLSLACFAEDRSVRKTIANFLDATAPYRHAMQIMRDTITAQLDDAFRFDRPDLEPDHFRDGILRPQWMTAYLSSRTSYSFEGKTYPVFKSDGRAWPPEVCVDFVVDTFVRAGGSWFRPQGETPGRTPGRLDLRINDKPPPRGVIGFADFAELAPDLFDVLRFQGEQRVPFGERTKFFTNLRDLGEEVRPGDIVSIQGLKRDDNVHQHAILVERTDPLTGFPYGLTDQMRRPRRRTWEGIMAEAPKRSLFFRVRPKDAVWEKIAPPKDEQ